MKTIITTIVAALAVAVAAQADTTVQLPQVRNGQLVNPLPAPPPTPSVPQLYGQGGGWGANAGVIIPGNKVSGSAGATVTSDGRVIGVEGGVRIPVGH
jgi:hypothetical protein